jgi:prepilin-type N-terminal cleavage/methylation domain-containing protein
MAREAPRPAGGRGGFSLLELVTVVAIMGILTGLIAVSVAGIGRRQRIAGTRDLLAALSAALRDYAADHNDRFPWTSDTGVMHKVRSDLDVGTGDLKEEVVLYLALTARERKGPYYRGDLSHTIVIDEAAGLRVFGDAWKRPIQYTPPQGGEVAPRLRSDGPDPDPGETDDDIYNYDD